jgi:photosystem II stability/assembly factor-like uncharacterized protein
LILISNGGDNTSISDRRSDTIIVGTVDGLAIVARSGEQWTVADRVLRGCNFSAVTRSPNGTLFAASHGVGVARSQDSGKTWSWCNTGLNHFDLWSARAGRLQGREVVCVGSLPAHLYTSEDNGDTWRELDGLRKVASVSKWCFPPAPHIGHVKDIAFDGQNLMVGIEIGGLLVSKDFGASFTELPVDPNPVECDIHRIVVHAKRPGRIIVANGIVGVMFSEDSGETWARSKMPLRAEYPDAIVVDPENPDMIYLGVGDGWPPHWYQRGRARGKILRSRDAGQTWERLLGGLPDGQRALFSALTVEASNQGTSLFAADTDGQIFESTDGGDSWTIIADVAPVSKGEFYRALVKDRVKLANVDDLVLSVAAANRFDSTAA